MGCAAATTAGCSMRTGPFWRHQASRRSRASKSLSGTAPIRLSSSTGSSSPTWDRPNANHRSRTSIRSMRRVPNWCPIRSGKPCNWLHVHENIVDASHVLFLHSAMGSQQLGPNMAIMPRFEYRETDDGHGCLYVTTRRVGEYVWVRCIHTLLPNVFQAASLYGEIDFERFYQRTSMTRWTVPIDDTNAMIFGLRHFNDKTDASEFSDRSKVGKERIDFAPGQTGGRPYEETQRDPGDWDVLVRSWPHSRSRRRAQGHNGRRRDDPAPATAARHSARCGTDLSPATARLGRKGNVYVRCHHANSATRVRRQRSALPKPAAGPPISSCKPPNHPATSATPQSRSGSWR